MAAAFEGGRSPVDVSRRKTFFPLLPASISGRTNPRLLEISTAVRFSLFLPEALIQLKVLLAVPNSQCLDQTYNSLARLISKFGCWYADHKVQALVIYP